MEMKGMEYSITIHNKISAHRTMVLYNYLHGLRTVVTICLNTSHSPSKSQLTDVLLRRKSINLPATNQGCFFRHCCISSKRKANKYTLDVESAKESADRINIETRILFA
eukprot:1116288_1